MQSDSQVRRRVNQRSCARARPRIRRPRRRREGMTLIEIMIVVIIMAMIAGGVGVAVLPRLEKAKVNKTKTDAAAIASAATMWIAENGGCPSVQDLIDDQILKRGTTLVDEWDNEFSIECDADGPAVSSAGPDGEMGTEDDIGT
ncbi:MAG: prepilin-type N-terminal cleavage/methylation domain-containing protein [Proteobacteria bacterium]|nr:prepilin-type N-terminal cleavage/methylation domain-containing protein [Pseudomonadota bacterium]